MYADEYGPRRPSRPLQMVSFLETEMVTDDTRVRAASRSRLRDSNSSSGRKIELESSDEVSFDFDYFVTTGRLDKPKSPQVSTNRRKSAQVSTSEPKIKKQHDSSANFKAAVKASSEKVSAASAIDSEVLFSRINKASTLELETDLGTNATIEKPAIATNSTNSLPRSNSTSTKSKNKSSTMPGFIRDEGLDDYVAVKTTKMLSPRRKVSRMVRSKSARKNRRQINSESLYRKSPSVPDSLLDYAQEIHAISRVTPKEEIELGTKTQEAIRLQKMFDDLYSKYGREPTNDEWCAAAGKINMQALEEALQAGNDAKNQLVASNLRMVQRVVNLYIRNGLGSEYNAGDLMQDGTMVSYWTWSYYLKRACHILLMLPYSFSIRH
jgi:DNA-directed RNA polymerase sigma subunit (sigma70/sigma32)